MRFVVGGLGGMVVGCSGLRGIKSQNFIHDSLSITIIPKETKINIDVFFGNEIFTLTDDIYQFLQKVFIFLINDFKVLTFSIGNKFLRGVIMKIKSFK